MSGVKKDDSKLLGYKVWKFDDDTSHQLKAKYLNNMEKTSLRKKHNKINDAKTRSIKKIFSHNLQLRHEMSVAEREYSSESSKIKLKLNDPYTIISLFDKEKTLIGFYEACLTKKINQDNAAKRISAFSILPEASNGRENLAVPTIKNIEQINNETKSEATRKLSQSVISLPVIQANKSKNSITPSEKISENDELLENSDFEYLARRISLMKHPQYMLSVQKGAIKRHKSIVEAPKKFRIAPKKGLINRFQTKDYF